MPRLNVIEKPEQSMSLTAFDRQDTARLQVTKKHRHRQMKTHSSVSSLSLHDATVLWRWALRKFYTALYSLYYKIMLHHSINLTWLLNKYRNRFKNICTMTERFVKHINFQLLSCNVISNTRKNNKSSSLSSNLFCLINYMRVILNNPFIRIFLCVLHYLESCANELSVWLLNRKSLLTMNWFIL